MERNKSLRWLDDVLDEAGFSAQGGQRNPIPTARAIALNDLLDAYETLYFTARDIAAGRPGIHPALHQNCAPHFYRRAAMDRTFTRREIIIANLDGSIGDLLYYGREEDETLPIGSIPDAIKEGEITVQEMIDVWSAALVLGLAREDCQP